MYVKSMITKKAIPTVFLLIKDHKKKPAGERINRMVVPATNFTAGFSNAGYGGIKHLPRQK